MTDFFLRNPSIIQSMMFRFSTIEYVYQQEYRTKTHDYELKTNQQRILNYKFSSFVVFLSTCNIIIYRLFVIYSIDHYHNIVSPMIRRLWSFTPENFHSSEESINGDRQQEVAFYIITNYYHFHWLKTTSMVN